MKKLYFLAVVIVFTGCGSSSPRFGASEAKNKTHHAKKAAPRFVSPEAKEEAAEDDVKVDTEQIVGRMKASSVRSSKKRPKRASSTAAKTSPKKQPAADTAPEAAEDDSVRSATADTSAVAIDQQKMMETIAQWLETPYSYGSDGEEAGIDCSAFTREVFEQALNITLPRSSAEQAQIGERVARNELKFGDLVFFRTRGRAISHVGIYIGDDLFAHASSGSGVTISSLDSTYFNKRYAAARRVTK